jgi:hypothetical protein
VLGDDPDTNSPQMVLNASVEPGPFDGTPGTGADGTDAAGPTVAGLDAGETLSATPAGLSPTDLMRTADREWTPAPGQQRRPDPHRLPPTGPGRVAA